MTNIRAENQYKLTKRRHTLSYHNICWIVLQNQKLRIFTAKQFNQFDPPSKSNAPGWPEQDQQQPPAQRLYKEYELFPVQQISGFQTGDMCFAQPGIPVVGNQHAPNAIQPQHLLQAKVPPFNTDSSQARTGQGDPYFYQDVYVNTERQLMGGLNHPGDQMKLEITKTRSVPFLSSAKCHD